MAFNLYWAFIEQIRKRLLVQNKNWLTALCGATGSGKTYSALQFAIDITKGRFRPQGYVAFTPKMFMEIVSSDYIKKGDCIIFDEAGVGMANREWMSVSNKLLGFVLQTFRHRNFAIIMTVPSLTFIDVQARHLLHTYMKTKGIDFKRELCFVSPYKFDYNEFVDKNFLRHISLVSNSGRVVEIESLGIRMPPEDIIDEYETIKRKYTDELYKNVYNEIIALQKGKKKSGRKKPIV